MVFAYLIVVLGIFACSASQLLLKSSAQEKHEHRFLELLNVRVITAYSVFIVSLLLNIWAMGNGVLLKEVAMLESLGYIFVPLLSWLVLKETIKKRTVFAITIIILGIFVFYL